MFVIRCLIAVLATISATLALCLGAGYSVWQSIGVAVLAAIFLQALVLCYVILCTIRGARKSPRETAAQQDHPHLGDQLFILPK